MNLTCPRVLKCFPRNLWVTGCKIQGVGNLVEQKENGSCTGWWWERVYGRSCESQARAHADGSSCPFLSSTIVLSSSAEFISWPWERDTASISLPGFAGNTFLDYLPPYPPTPLPSHPTPSPAVWCWLEHIPAISKSQHPQPLKISFCKCAVWARYPFNNLDNFILQNTA